ncbi:MAG: hypothetical protein ACKO83_04945, partial [Roseiflexaceae bacterium]
VLPGGDIALCKAKTVSAWRALPFNMSAYIHPLVTLRIEVRTDVSFVSSLWIDDIGFVRTATEPLTYYGKSAGTSTELPVNR